MSSDGSDTNRTIIFPTPQTLATSSASSEFSFSKVPVARANKEIFDTAFTKAVGCTQYHPGGCEGLRRDHRFADAVPLGEHWKYKYLIDFDGMGYSARLFAFLMSESAVVKNTIYREFFSDWIQPWYVTLVLRSSPQSNSAVRIGCISSLSAQAIPRSTTSSPTSPDRPLLWRRRWAGH